MSKKAWTYNCIAGLVALIIYFFLAPDRANAVFFKGILLHLPYVITIIPSAIFLFGWLLRTRGIVDRRFIITSISIVVLNAIWIAGLALATGYITYQKYAKFNPRGSMVVTDLEKIRYNARQTAFVDMNNSITAATEEIALDHANPVITENGFGYIAPITPDGFLVTFTQNNPGYVLFDDSYQAVSKIERINQEQKVGQDMLLFDDIERVLYLTDFFADYEEPHYIALDPHKPKRFTAIVPKIKYSWLSFPYWAGVVLVHDDGKVEELSVQEVTEDARLKDKWVFPIGLAKKYVNLQNYNTEWGMFSPLVRVKGKLEIEKLPGENQFPFLTPGADKHLYHVVATKAAGSGGGLYRMYYIDASTGEKTYYEYAQGVVVYGPAAGLMRVPNLAGYNWYREDSGGGSGNIIAIEPVYIVRFEGDELHWKYSITNKDYAGVSAVAVAPASDLDNITEYKNRDDFEAWLRAVEVNNGADRRKDEIMAIKNLLAEALRKLQMLEVE